MKTRLLIRLSIQLMVLAGCAKNELEEIPVSKAGCLDMCALNFNPEAFEDNGSCEYPGSLSDKLTARTWVVISNLAIAGNLNYSNNYVYDSDTVWNSEYDSLEFNQDGQMLIYKSNGELVYHSWSISADNLLVMPSLGFESELDFLADESLDCWVLLCQQREVLAANGYYEVFWEHNLSLAAITPSN